MKNIVPVLSVILILLGIGNAQAAVLSVDTTPGGSIESLRTVSVGSNFDVDIVIMDIMDFAGFQIDLEFDDTVITATAVTSGGIFNPDTFALFESIGSDSVSFAEGSLAFAGVDIVGPEVLVTISFDSVSTGSSILALSNVIVSDSFGSSILPVDLSGGEVTVPTPATMLLLATGLVVLRFARPS